MQKTEKVQKPVNHTNISPLEIYLLEEQAGEVSKAQFTLSVKESRQRVKALAEGEMGRLLLGIIAGFWLAMIPAATFHSTWLSVVASILILRVCLTPYLRIRREIRAEKLAFTAHLCSVCGESEWWDPRTEGNWTTCVQCGDQLCHCCRQQMLPRKESWLCCNEPRCRKCRGEEGWECCNRPNTFIDGKPVRFVFED